MTIAPAPPEHPIEEVLLGFTTALRAAGLAITHDRSTAFLDAVRRVGLDDATRTALAGRATLCSSPDDLERFDQVWEAWFGDREGLPRSVPRDRSKPLQAPLPTGDEGTGGEGEEEPETVQVAASEVEVLRERDVASLTPNEKSILDAMLSQLRAVPPRRRATRRTPARRGEVDLSRTLRASLRHLGEPARIRHRRRGVEARRVVLLVDVSASMKPYLETILRVAHRVVHSGGPVEVFTLGTRLTRVTPPLRSADTERALVRAGAEIADWAGGTRLGETLAAFNDRWGARGLARGAVVVVLSDGWERGDCSDLGEQVRRLHRLAHRVVWVNPHRGKDGYEPVQQGIVAVLPFVDDFIAGHSLRAYQQLLEVIARA